MNSPTGPLANPAIKNNVPASIEPVKFPIKLTIQTLIVSSQETVLFNDPTAITKLFPVNNSDPAKITRLKATPNDNPITIFVAGELAELSNPPIVKINIIPNPT